MVYFLSAAAAHTYTHFPPRGADDDGNAATPVLMRHPLFGAAPPFPADRADTCVCVCVWASVIFSCVDSYYHYYCVCVCVETVCNAFATRVHKDI